jgi:hypothetical protein
MITEKQQKIYDLKKAEKLLDKHKILDAKQKSSINVEVAKEKVK